MIPTSPPTCESLCGSLVSQGIEKQQVAERADRRVTTHATRTRAKTARTD